MNLFYAFEIQIKIQDLRLYYSTAHLICESNMNLDSANFINEFQKRLSNRVIIAFHFEFLLNWTDQASVALFFSVRTITKIMAGKNWCVDWKELSDQGKWLNLQDEGIRQMLEIWSCDTFLLFPWRIENTLTSMEIFFFVEIFFLKS